MKSEEIFSVLVTVMVQKSKVDRYWFKEDELLKPIDWEYVLSLPQRVQNALELYMRGRVSIGKAAEIGLLSFREFDSIRARARIPVRM